MTSPNPVDVPVVVSLIGSERDLVRRVSAARLSGADLPRADLPRADLPRPDLSEAPSADGLSSVNHTRVVELHRAATHHPSATILAPTSSDRASGRASGRALTTLLGRPAAHRAGVVAAIDPMVLDVVFASLDPQGAAPGAMALDVLARAHGFEVRVESAADPALNGHTPAPGSHRTAVRQLRHRARKVRRSYAGDQTEWAKRFPGFGGQAPAAGSSYAGSQELHALSKSVRFHRWMAEMLRPAVGHDVLEVGAGIGTMTRALAETYPQANLVSIEPDPALFGLLADRAPTGVTSSTQSTLELPAVASYDTLLYVNVLEHIEDHAGELQRARSLLRPGGRIGIIVPALPSLYGSLDAKTGHFRRYQKQPLRALVEGAGLRVVELSYFDTVGVLPYWASIKLGSMPALSDRTTMLFDSVLVPLSKAVRRVWPSVPIGKNLLVIAERPD